MFRTLTKRVFALVVCIAFPFVGSGYIAAQSPNLGKERQVLVIELLTAPQGTNFGPYFKQILPNVKEHWHVPESEQRKKGTVAIRLNVRRDGKVSKMRLVEKSHDAVLDNAAWEALRASPALPPLPSDFHAAYLTLRFRFFYNPEQSDLPRATDVISLLRSKSQHRISVSIAG